MLRGRTVPTRAHDGLKRETGIKIFYKITGEVVENAYHGLHPYRV